MDVASLLSGLQANLSLKPNPAAERFLETGHPGRALGHASKPDFTPLNAPKAQGLLDRQVLNQLNETLSKQGAALPQTLDPNDFTPEAVSDRILGFIRGALAGAEDDGQRSELLEQARAGVEQGLAEARDILDGLGVLSGQIAADVDRTETLIFEGLDALAAPAEAAAPAPAGNEGFVTRSGLESAAVQASQSSAVEIRTRDGDVVSIEFNRSFSASQSAAFTEGPDGSAFSVEATASRSAAFSFSVQGELDGDEQEAIADLLKDIDKVSERFFEGDVQGAFQKAAQLELDDDELAAFSVDLNASVSRQAVSAYEVTASNGAALPAGNPAQRLADFISDVNATLNDPNAGLFASPQQAVGELLGDVTATKADAFGIDGDDDDGTLALLKAFVEQLQAASEESESDDGEADEVLAA